MSTGTQIAKYRKQRGMTQNALAEKLEVSFQAVSSWERDEYAPDVSRLNELAAALGTTVARLLSPSAAEELPERESFGSGEHMYTFLKTVCRSSSLVQQALPFAREIYAGQKLPGTEVPFFDLPLTLACHCFSMGLAEEDMTAALLAYAGEMPGCPEGVKNSVGLFRAYAGGTFDPASFQTDRRACLLVLLDAVHAPAAGKRTAQETAALALKAEKCALPLVGVLKQGTAAENNAAWLLSRALMEQIELIRRFI